MVRLGSASVGVTFHCERKKLLLAPSLLSVKESDTHKSECIFTICARDTCISNGNRSMDHGNGYYFRVVHHRAEPWQQQRSEALGIRGDCTCPDQY